MIGTCPDRYCGNESAPRSLSTYLYDNPGFLLSDSLQILVCTGLANPQRYGFSDGYLSTVHEIATIDHTLLS